MGYLLAIEDDKTSAMAPELAALTGESFEEAVSPAINLRISFEQRGRAAMEKARQAVASFHDFIENARPSIDRG